MSTKISLKAETRKITGRQTKKLRRQGILPANLYGKNTKSQALQVSQDQFAKVFKQAGETNVVDLTINENNNPKPVLISNVQLHPVTDSFLHADFRQVDLTQKINVDVPVNLIGESPAVETGGVLVQTLNEIEIEALPTNLPESIDFDLSTLKEIGDSLSISDAKPLKNAAISLDPETIVVTIQAQKEEEEPEPEPTPTEETEDQAADQPVETEDKKEAPATDEPASQKPADQPAETR